jgi:hypothetical protein
VKTLAGEVLVAATLTSALIPVALAGGVRWSYALEAAFVWFASFVLGTLTVHAIKARLPGDGTGNWIVMLAPATASAVLGFGVVVVWARLWPPTAALALFPTGVAALAISLWRVQPRQLRIVGWSLVAANVATAALLIAGR